MAAVTRQSSSAYMDLKYRRGTEPTLSRCMTPSASTRSLDTSLQNDMMNLLGHDFSRVQIHTDQRAAESARAFGARAYTVGPQIVFGKGEYRPDTGAGRSLLAHELTHVVQQDTSPRTGSDQDAENEATNVAANVASNHAAPAIKHHVAAGTVQRQVDDSDSVPVPAQTQVSSWSPGQRGIFGIVVESDKAAPGGSGGSAGSGVSTGRFSSFGHIEHFCTTPARYPLRVRFYTDSVAIPRPQSFAGPALRAQINFTPDGQTAPTFSRSVNDSNPRYLGPGYWLEPSFGTQFSVADGDSGQLDTHLELLDAAHNIRVTYADTIRCLLVPCV